MNQIRCCALDVSGTFHPSTASYLIEMFCHPIRSMIWISLACDWMMWTTPLPPQIFNFLPFASEFRDKNPRCPPYPTRFQCPNLDWNFKICGTKFGLNLDLRKNDYFIKNALPWRNIKISMIQVNFGKVWPSLILVRTDTIFSSFGTRVFLEVLVPKLEKVVTVRTKFRLGHSFSKLAWIREIFTQRHGNAFLLEWSFLLKFKISPNLVLKILKFQSKFGHRNRVGSLSGSLITWLMFWWTVNAFPNFTVNGTTLNTKY